MVQLSSILVAIWVMLPAYLPNNAAVVAGGGRPIDAGRTWRGQRLLGDGKTWRGFIAGVVTGVSAAGIANTLRPVVVRTVGIPVPVIPLDAALALALGAMLGDMAASFVKRRTARPRGAPVPVVDQLDFVLGALACATIVAPLWVVTTVAPLAALILIGTPLLHVSANGVAYAARLKNEPW